MSNQFPPPNYSDPQVQVLADEAINKIRLLFQAKAPSSLFIGEDAEELRMECLGNLLEWKFRYMPTLGKLKYFLSNYPLCAHLFELRETFENTATQSFALSQRVTGTRKIHLSASNLLDVSQSDTKRLHITAASGGGSKDKDIGEEGEDFDLNDTVVSSAIVKPLSSVELDEVNRRAFASIRSLLLTQTQADPIYSMKLTPLNTRAKWVQYRAHLNSLKSWIVSALREDSTHYLVIIDGRGPGNDIVQLRQKPDMYESSSSSSASSSSSSSSSGAAAASTADSDASCSDWRAAAMSTTAQLPVLSPPLLSTTDTWTEGAVTGAPRPPAAYKRALSDSDTGIHVADFFNIPLGGCTTEIAYQKSMARTADLIKTFARQGILSNSFKYGEERFEQLEWLGDSVLHMQLSLSTFMSRSLLLDVNGLTIRRQNAEQRLTLALIFDELRLAENMIVCPESWVADKWKAKGDIVEAMLGELYVKLHVATEPGFLFDREQRDACERMIQMITAAALERGPRLKGHAERQSMMDAARAFGGGGMLQTRYDSEATLRTLATREQQQRYQQTKQKYPQLSE